MSKFKNANDVIWVPEKKGDTLEGLLKSISPWKPPENFKKRGEVNQYIIEDVKGVEWSMIGGTVLDNIIEEQTIVAGMVVRFMYNGQKESKTGDLYKKWGVQYIPIADLSKDWRDDLE